MKFSPEKPKFAEGVVEFDEITCCALAHAFAKNKEAVQQLKEAVGSDELRKMAEILPTTKNMAFFLQKTKKLLRAGFKTPFYCNSIFLTDTSSDFTKRSSM